MKKQDVIRPEPLSPTFCGHSIVEEITIRDNHIDLDTGGFKKYWKSPGHHRITMVKILPFLRDSQWE